MLTNLAALGIGIITTVVAAPAAAQVYTGANYPTVNYPAQSYPNAGYPATYPAAPYPTYGAPVPAYGVPVPAYGVPVPVYTPAVPVYVPAPPPAWQRRRSEPVSVRRADYNRDGTITFAEAHAYGRNEFARADDDRNGALTRRELNNRYDEIANGARRRDHVVTFAEYDQSLRHQFGQLDRNRDGLLSGYELGRSSAEPHVVTFNWHWEL